MYRDIIKYIWKGFIDTDDQSEAYRDDIKDLKADLYHDDFSGNTQDHGIFLRHHDYLNSKIRSIDANTLS